MAEAQVYDLDILKPPSVIVKLLGFDIEIGFVPAGVAMKVERLQNDLAELDEKHKGKTRAEKAADPDYGIASMQLMTDVVLLVAAASAPELTRERLLNECTVGQLDQLITLAYKHMYGPKTGALFSDAIAEAEAETDGTNGNGTAKEPKKGGAPAKAGRSGSPKRESSTGGHPPIAKPSATTS